MTGKMQYTAVGAFVLILGAAFTWGVLWISAGGAPQRFDRYLIYMTESVSGLNVDSALKYRGLDVGKVEQMAIDLETPERIRIVLQIREDIPVTEDTRATIEYQGLTGLANINLSGGTATSEPLERQPGEEYPVIQTSPSLLARLDSTTTDLLANLIQTSTRINALLDDDNRTNLARTLQNIATMSDNLAAQSGQLDEV
ncbi:MAG: MlaD family protein, partial [Woeseia sp.]